MDKGIYALLIKNEKGRKIRVGSLGTIYFAPGYYVYIGSAQKNLHKRIERHYSREKKLRWHIDYFLQYTEIVRHYSLSLPKECEEKIAIFMEESFESIKGFGASDSRAHSHLFYGDADIWTYVQSLFWKCIKK